MAAAYDSFDYPAYWKGRDYEHESEVIAIKKLISQIPKIKKIIDIGAGFGRLTPYYRHRARKVVLTDPSRSLLSIAQKGNRDITTVQTSLENLPQKFRAKSFDLAMMIRVMHHLKDPDEAIGIISKLLSDNGYLIIEFPNKLHWKALMENFLHGNFTFPLEIYPTDKRSKKNKKANTLPFLNFHPDIIFDSLKKHRFVVIDTLSVSNIRLAPVKKNLPIDFLLAFEAKLQSPLARLRFGPSLFVLARKRST